MVAHRVRQSADGVVENEQIFVLVLAEGKDQSVQDESQVRHQLGAGLLLQSGKGTGWETEEECTHTAGLLMCHEITRLRCGYLQAASCTRLLLSRIRLSSSVMSGFR